MRLIVAALVVAAATPAAGQAPLPQTKDCLQSARIQQQRIVDDRTILFREGSHWYRNDLAVACQGLDPEKSLSARTPSAQLCAGDPVTVFERVSNFTYGACALGRFTRIPDPGAPPRRR